MGALFPRKQKFIEKRPGQSGHVWIENLAKTDSSNFNSIKFFYIFNKTGVAAIFQRWDLILLQQKILITFVDKLRKAYCNSTQVKGSDASFFKMSNNSYILS